MLETSVNKRFFVLCRLPSHSLICRLFTHALTYSVFAQIRCPPFGVFEMLT